MARGLGLPARGLGVAWRLAGVLALLAALLGGLLATPGMAAAATRSGGCLLVDGYVSTTTAFTLVVNSSFNAGEVITYTAAAQGGTPTVVIIQRDDVTVATAPYPGPATYTIPTTGAITKLAFTHDTTDIPVTKTLTCTPPLDPSAVTQVRGSATYGDATGSVTARLTTTGSAPIANATVNFTIQGTSVGSAVTNAQGVATLTNAAMPAGLNAGTYPNRVCASYAGDTTYLPTGPTCGPLVIGRAILWVKPVDRTVGLKQPNPPTDPHLDPANCAAPNWCLELTRGSTFVNGQSWSALGLTNLRFQYSRNPPSTNATEYVGKTYRMTAFGATSGNYDIRYDPGTLKVVAAP